MFWAPIIWGPNINEWGKTDRCLHMNQLSLRTNWFKFKNLEEVPTLLRKLENNLNLKGGDLVMLGC